MKQFNINEKTANFLKTYNLYKNDEVQQIQLQHRLSLVDTFEISEGMRVLEIGCGQGDTTVALAHAVGETGHVIAIDIANPDYGAPLTLGQATNVITQSDLGNRISFHFETDFAFFEVNKPFDVVVLSHSSWYFRQPETLLDYFRKMKAIAKKVCFAEWDLDYGKPSQRNHFLAASILALYSNFVNNDGNIQNLFYKEQVKSFLQLAGFSIQKETTVNATFLQDGDWEIGYANHIRPKFSIAPTPIQTLVQSYYDLMKNPTYKKESLDSFVIVAE
ncbi:class I SAM-dependent methyltransferase [Ornithinibacillus halotolerans]|uniref:SAM-dependent methyltransferase n=1 Tax=Ornithinibacillus halotolerans TaxID=1274357 RepID=A0A916S6D0_9BACI|nr:methyltransferase domain-containing protein [Ornithinibacillus halotolerans]GGA86684.1 SAM-dependent methyltransferase [Ornithinibacillus halotolerans]